jgi:hypothetical protein
VLSTPPEKATATCPIFFMDSTNPSYFALVSMSFRSLTVDDIYQAKPNGVIEKSQTVIYASAPPR